MPVKIIADTSEIKRILDHWGGNSNWVPSIIHSEMPRLGKRINLTMRAQLHSHRYRGVLEDSVEDTYNPALAELTIGPAAQRGGRYDAGIILEKGTVPIPNCPWRPIKEWGQVRGLTPKRSFFILTKIRQQGVSAHPFLIQTMQRADFITALEDAAGRMGISLAAKAVATETVLGAAIT